MFTHCDALCANQSAAIAPLPLSVYLNRASQASIRIYRGLLLSLARSLAGLVFTLIIVPAEDVLHYHVRHASVVCRPIVFNNRSAAQIATEVLTYSIAENLCWRKLLRG